MATRYLVKDGDSLDEICQGHYGFVNGAVEVLKANVPVLSRFDTLGVLF